MANTTKLQVNTTHSGNPPKDVETFVRPLPASWAILHALSLPLEGVYSALCFESEAGSWVKVDRAMHQEISALQEFGLVEVAA